MPKTAALWPMDGPPETIAIQKISAKAFHLSFVAVWELRLGARHCRPFLLRGRMH